MTIYYSLHPTLIHYFGALSREKSFISFLSSFLSLTLSHSNLDILSLYISLLRPRNKLSLHPFPLFLDIIKLLPPPHTLVRARVLPLFEFLARGRAISKIVARFLVSVLLFLYGRKRGYVYSPRSMIDFQPGVIDLKLGLWGGFILFAMPAIYGVIGFYGDQEYRITIFFSIYREENWYWHTWAFNYYYFFFNIYWKKRKSESIYLCNYCICRPLYISLIVKSNKTEEIIQVIANIELHTK